MKPFMSNLKIDHTSQEPSDLKKSSRARSLSPLKRIRPDISRPYRNGTGLTLKGSSVTNASTPNLNGKGGSCGNLTSAPPHTSALPRWPSECQVLLSRIKHIRSNPTDPELFYEVTGKEPQPRPIGEEHGALSYEYNVTSPVNYFSRSISGPSNMYPNPDPPKNLNQSKDGLQFESRFECGNLAKAIRVTESYYELHLRPDLYTNKHCQWFYFQVKNTRSDISYRFSIVNFSKPDSLYNYGMKPVLYSCLEAERHYVGWSRVGSDIRYYRNDTSSSGVDDDEDGPEGTGGSSYTLTFTMNFPHDDDVVYVAHCYPYSYSDLQDDLSDLQNNKDRSEFCDHRLLCRTLAGNNVYLLTISSPDSLESEDYKNKQVIILSARVHPGETPSSWIMRGILLFLTGRSEEAEHLRSKFVFKIVPMLNPDGVIVGNTRCSLTGRDLNRQYKSVIKEAFPPIFHMKSLVRKLMEETGIVLYCDLHAHSRKFNVFIYGCENRRHSEKYLKEQVFPLMLHKNSSEKFSFEDCKFRIQRQKETTGRVVFWNMGITCSYTMEASYGGTNMGSRAFTHFNTNDYESLGRYFCETLLDFYDPCPIKDQLRNKIITRLIKEGSSANEPANIALSEYSSLSSSNKSLSSEEDVIQSDFASTNDPKRRVRRSRRHKRRNNGYNGFLNEASTNGGANAKKKNEIGISVKKSEKSKENGKKRRRKGGKSGETKAKFMIGSSEDEEDNGDDNGVDHNGVGGNDDDDDEDPESIDDDIDSVFINKSSMCNPDEKTREDQRMSASSCRRVQSEIMASVNQMKYSWMTHHPYSHIGSFIAGHDSYGGLTSTTEDDEDEDDDDGIHSPMALSSSLDLRKRLATVALLHNKNLARELASHRSSISSMTDSTPRTSIGGGLSNEGDEEEKSAQKKIRKRIKKKKKKGVPSNGKNPDSPVQDSLAIKRVSRSVSDLLNLEQKNGSSNTVKPSSGVKKKKTKKKTSPSSSANGSKKLSP